MSGLYLNGNELSLPSGTELWFEGVKLWPTGVTTAQRIAAAEAAAAAAGELYETAGAFYWEVGDATGVLASGSVGTSPPPAATATSIASATKWLFGAYCAQTLTLAGTDFKFLNMSSGYNSMAGQCASGLTQTVSQCLLSDASWDDYTPLTDGTFWYNSAHFEKFGVDRAGLGDDKITGLRTKFEAALGVSTLQFTQPLLAGGAFMAPTTYGAFLRKLLDGTLNLGALLGTHQVPASAALGATHSPAPEDEEWYYSLGHWVEPDGSFSSGGSLGFYPWIDAGKTHYGMVVRTGLTAGTSTDIGIESVRTGQMIRAAWLAGEYVAGGSDFNGTTLDETFKGSGITLSNGDLTARSNAFQNCVCAVNPKLGNTTDILYWEVTVDEVMSDNYHLYISLEDKNLISDPQYSSGEGFDVNGQPGMPDPTVGVTYKGCVKNGKVYFGVVGGAWANGGNPDTETGAVGTLDAGHLYAPGVGWLTVGTGFGQVTFNFGSTAFIDTPPTGATGWPAS